MDPQIRILARESNSLYSSSSRLGRSSSLRRLLPHVRRRSTAVAPTSHPIFEPPSVSPSTTAHTTPTAHRRGLSLSGRARSVLVDSSTAANRLPPTREEGQAVVLPKKMRTPNLGINVHREVSDRDNANHSNNGGRNATDANAREAAGASPLSSPRTPHTPGPHSPFAQTFGDGYETSNSLHQSPVTAAPRHPSPKPPGKSVKSIFSNPIASRSTTKVHKSESPVRQANYSSGQQGSMAQVFSMNRANGSSPELTVTNVNSTENSVPLNSEDLQQYQNPDSLMAVSNQPKKKSSKHKFSLGLGRKTSLRDEENLQADVRNMSQKSKSKLQRDMNQKGSTYRAHSTDRQGSDDSGVPPGSGQPASIQHNIRSTGTRAADGLGRAAKGLLGKLSTRSSHSMDSRESQEKAAKAAKDEADAQRAFHQKSYKIINLPLEDQTRITRICKRLEDCKDKTEFWLPAVAYRCIDYLNDKGMAHEGLYRVPGSEREIRNWIWRFDNEHDIDLLNEEDLYDVNTISSMFKSWLRDLPDEVFPKSIQAKVVKAAPKHTDHPEAPEILKQELSLLPPFNYYLLFAVTAHITMLLNASKENKMTFNNLCVCFMPAMKLEMSCFQWLILDWKNCWRGCSTERDFLEKEYDLLEPKEVDQEGPIDPRERVPQHFDRYPPPHARPNDGPNGNGDHVVRQHTSRETSAERGRAVRNNGQKSHASSRSPAARPATSPVEASTRFPEGSAQTRRDKQRPPHLEAISHSRHGSEPAIKVDKSLKSLPTSQNGELTEVETLIEQRAKEQPSTPPEIGPVQPLSPFGSLDEKITK